MIVNSLKEGWEIIYQRAHANLAAMILSGWKKSENIHRPTETLIAVAQHDDQEIFWDKSVHLTDQGAPLDFMEGDLDTSMEQASLVIANAYRQGLWIALMISMHNSCLYEPLRGTNAGLNRFLDAQKYNQDQWRKQIKISKETAARSYALVLFADTLSLILCRRQLPIQSRRLEVSPTPDDQSVMVFQREDKSIGLDPWIFEQPAVQFSLESRRLNQLAYNNEAEFKTALDEAPLEVITWDFSK